MKRTIYIALAAIAATFALSSCKSEYIQFDGPSVVAFSDTSFVCPVQQSVEEFGVDIAATNACSYDRTFVVDAIPGKSTAVFGKHYSIDNQTVTIKAGERAAKVFIKGNYDSLEAGEDETYIGLKLIGVEDNQWEFNSQETKVYLRKVCPFNIDDFTGKCTVMSSFLLSFLKIQEREAVAEKIDDETIVIRGMFEDGYDVKYRFDLSDVLYPTMYMVEETVIGDSRTFMNYIHGNGQLLGSDVMGYTSELNLCEKYLNQYMMVRVDEVGTVGLFVNIIQFGEDE